jgi:hypothetical protein
MIRDVHSVAGVELGYARRTFSFPGGEVHVFIANNQEVAEVFDAAARVAFKTVNATPPSTKN